MRTVFVESLAVMCLVFAVTLGVACSSGDDDSDSSTDTDTDADTDTDTDTDTDADTSTMTWDCEELKETGWTTNLTPENFCFLDSSGAEHCLWDFCGKVVVFEYLRMW